MYNEKVQIVSVFKDYLIMDDLTEFLKRPYTLQESTIRLTKIFEFYENYSQIFPNYIAIPERKFMYKNIERKQRLLEQQDRHSSSSDESSSDPSEPVGTPPR